MRNQKKLVLEQLDRKLGSFTKIDTNNIPSSGWIKSIRSALNMSLMQLGKKLNKTRQGVKKIEEREATGSISIKSLKEVGEALNMKLVYGFIPEHGSLEKLVEIKAHNLARKIVLRTSHNMKLENQGNSDKRISQAIDDLASEIKREMRKSLWD
jgi:predicted DNA-binding mobile mystery protein A